MSSPNLAHLDWPRIHADLDARGVAPAGRLLDDGACAALRAQFVEETPFRSHIHMARHGFGRGEYKYFAYPLPEIVAGLRMALYPHLAPVANRWAELLGQERRFPQSLDSMLARCHGAGQKRPTPLLLRYQADDYNCLHQDLYGEHVFPLQVVICLSEPGVDFEGGEFTLVEQRPRMQSRVEVTPLRMGEAAIFAVSSRPRQGVKGFHRVNLKHGVSRVRRGRRFALGVIFHDAA